MLLALNVGMLKYTKRMALQTCLLYVVFKLKIYIYIFIPIVNLQLN